MDRTVQMECILIVGIIAGVALYMGQNEIASACVGGLVGFLSAERLITE